MIIKFNPDGSFKEKIGSNIFQNSNNANTVFIEIDKPQNSTALINIVQDDRTELEAKFMTPVLGEEESSWSYTFSKTDLSLDGDIYLSFTIKYNDISLQTETYTARVLVSASSSLTPIDPTIEEQILRELTKLNVDKVGRYSVAPNDIHLLPPEIVFNRNGEKTPNNLYYNFEYDKTDIFPEPNVDGTARGVLFVFKPYPNIQYEYLFETIHNIFDTNIYFKSILNNDTNAKFRNINSQIDRKIGNLNDLETTLKDNLVGAINEVLNRDKEYVDEKLEDYYDKTESDERFVHLQGDESIAGVKTFTDKVLVEDPTSNKMPVNRQTMQGYMQGYAYSKEEINNLTTPIGFETEQNFLNWLSGTFTRPDGILPSDLLIGKKVIIQEEGKNNYQVAEVPVVDLSDFKVLVEDNKFAEEIGFKPYETIEADNVQDAVEEVKDEVDLKTQIVRLDNLVIESNEWVEENGEVYFDHMIPEFTNSLEQEIEIVNNNKTQSDLFIAEQITVKAVETIGAEPSLGIRLILNKAPSETITLSVFMSNSTNITIEAGEIVAKNVFYDNTASGLIADNVQDAIDEVDNKIDNIDLDDYVRKDATLITSSADQSVYVKHPDGSVRLAKASISSGASWHLVKRADNGYINVPLTPTESQHATSKQYVDDELSSKADKTYVDNFKLYNHKIILNNNLYANNSYVVFVNLILNTNIEITTLTDLNAKIVSIYGNQSIPATGTFHTTVDDKYWYNINSISSIGNGLALGGMGYQSSSSSDLKPYITQAIGLDGTDGWTLVSDTVVELN